ncbi:MAG TPA: ankyrin repeat domain-containing protein [Pirellulales bacterium]|nr:ankyrin repeat domain-containing protein [Pirellulales bacterium]
MADAQRVLARAYGFSSWPALKNHVEGVHFAALFAAAEAGDVAVVRRIAKAHPEWINHQADVRGGALHRAVLRRDVELTRVLMRLGADARTGIWPHRDATSAYAIAVDREYSEIVATIEREEDNRRARLSHERKSTSAAVGALRHTIAEGRAAEAIALMEGDPALISACDVYGVTPLHVAAWKHDPALVGWLLDHGASPDALALRAVPVRVPADEYPVESGKTPLDFAAFVAGRAPEGRDSIFYFMENAHVDPAQFHETARLLLEKGAELTPRAAVALGDREAVLRLHREGRLHNEIHFVRGGLISIAVRVNRPEMVSLLLDLALDPDESVPTDDGFRSWGMPLWFASQCGRHEIAELLLARGADVNAVVYACGDSICSAGDEKMEALLRQYGARLTVETVTDPKTAQAILDGTVTAYSLGDAEPLKLQDAAERLCGGDPEFIRMCLPHITRKRDDPWWNSVLMNAKVPEGLQIVLDHGVDPDIPSDGGYTLLHHLTTPVAGRRGAFVPTEEERLQRATMLLDAGASLTKRDSLLKSTPLGWACRWGRSELVRLYLQRGADPVEADAEPWATPLAWATNRGHHEIIKLLRTHGAR